MAQLDDIAFNEMNNITKDSKMEESIMDTINVMVKIGKVTGKTTYDQRTIRAYLKEIYPDAADLEQVLIDNPQIIEILQEGRAERMKLQFPDSDRVYEAVTIEDILRGQEQAKIDYTKDDLNRLSRGYLKRMEEKGNLKSSENLRIENLQRLDLR